MPLFTTLTDARICDEIQAARKHVILAAPGIGMQVAKALQFADQRLGDGAVQVVLDISARIPLWLRGIMPLWNHCTKQELPFANIPDCA